MPVENVPRAAARARIDIVRMQDRPDSEQDRTRPANTCTCASFLGFAQKDTYASRQARTSPARAAPVSQVLTLAGSG